MLRVLFLVSTFLVTACASTPAAMAPADASLRIVSWNMEHLATANGSGCKPRTEADYAALRAMVQRLDADIIAFQEVESAAAAQRVFDPQIYTIIIEERAGSNAPAECRGLPGQYLNRQAVGFAVRRSLEIERRPDLTALQLQDPNLRSAVDIEAGRPGAPRLRLLAVHLKSGCASGQSGDACATLMAQAPILEAWIDARARAGEAFVVLGDFNRRLAIAGDLVWSGWDDSDPPGADLLLAGGAAGAHCDPRYADFIDHIVAPVAESTELSGFREWTFEGPRLSDHCPISIEYAPAP